MASHQLSGFRLYFTSSNIHRLAFEENISDELPLCTSVVWQCNLLYSVVYFQLNFSVIVFSIGIGIR